MQFRVLDRLTLDFVDGGAVADYQILNDYVTMNSSNITIYEPTEAKIGDLIALIKTSGAYYIGCITAIDEAGLNVGFKDGKEFFAGKQLNPVRFPYYKGEHGEQWEIRFDAVRDTARLVEIIYIEHEDEKARLPLQIVTSGSVTAIWQYEGNDFDFKNFLLDIFDRRNVVLQFNVIFGAERKLQIRIFVNNNTGDMIKDNIHLMELDINQEKQPTKTTCKVLSKETKEILKIYYLLDNDTITEDSKDLRRILPPMLTTAEYDSVKDSEAGIGSYDLAFDELSGQIFNHTVSVRIDKATNMINVGRLQIGNGVKILTKYGEIDTIYTGLEESGSENMVTLTFGKARVLYSDIIKLALRRFN